MPRFSLCLVAALTLSMGAGCKDQPSPPDDNGRPIKMLTVGESVSGWKREYPGTIAAAQEIEIGFEVPGRIVERPATSGQAVKIGDLLARLDKTTFEAAVSAARAQVTAAEIDVKRQRELIKVGGTSGLKLDEAERRFTTAKSDLETAEKALSDTELRAPFSGVVAKTIASNFTNVRAKEPIVTLQDPSWLEIDVNVPEADAVLARPGLSLEERNRRTAPHVIASVLPDRRIPAQITSFSTTADPVTRTYEATLVFPRPTDVSILPGMTARVEVELKSEGDGSEGIRIPASVVAGDNQSQPYVWVIGAEMKAVRRAVTLGEMSGSMVQVRTGLQPGERIALTGVHHLREGLLVREWETE